MYILAYSYRPPNRAPITRSATFVSYESAVNMVAEFDDPISVKSITLKKNSTTTILSLEDFNADVEAKKKELSSPDEPIIEDETQTIIPVEVFQTGLNAVKTDVTTMLPTALTVGLAIMGLLFAIHKGIDFFKGLAN